MARLVAGRIVRLTGAACGLALFRPSRFNKQCHTHLPDGINGIQDDCSASFVRASVRRLQALTVNDSATEIRRLCNGVAFSARF